MMMFHFRHNADAHKLAERVANQLRNDEQYLDVNAGIHFSIKRGSGKRQLRETPFDLRLTGHKNILGWKWFYCYTYFLTLAYFDSLKIPRLTVR